MGEGGVGLSPPSKGAVREKRWLHPRELGAVEAQAFLTHLAAVENVAVATQAQALNAIVFSGAESHAADSKFDLFSGLHGLVRRVQNLHHNQVCFER